MMRWDIINQLIEEKGYKRYLEIGYYKGWSFDNVSCETKVAVDPNPCKTPDQESMKSNWILNFKAGFPNFDRTHQLWKSTSDFFFEQIGNESKFDIIFIDGLHEAKQVSKDIENSVKCLSPGGTIVIHDCNPPKYEHTTTGIDGCWTGDVYKAFIDFKRSNPKYDCFVVDTDWGVGVIREMPAGTERVLTLPNIHQMSIDAWVNFDAYRFLVLNLVSPEVFKTGMKFIKDETITNNNSTAE